MVDGCFGAGMWTTLCVVRRGEGGEGGEGTRGRRSCFLLFSSPVARVFIDGWLEEWTLLNGHMPSSSCHIPEL